MIDSSFLMGFVAGAASVVFLFLLFGVGFLLFRPWMRLVLSGGKASMFDVVGMRLRGSPTTMIIDAYVSLLHLGESVRLAEVESQYVAHRGRIITAHDLRERVREFKHDKP